METEEETKLCENWYYYFKFIKLFLLFFYLSGKSIIIHKYDLHEAYCFRNIMKCP